MSIQQALAFPAALTSDTVFINARCTLRIEDEQRVVVIGGLPAHHYHADDLVAESYAMVFWSTRGSPSRTR